MHAASTAGNQTSGGHHDFSVGRYEDLRTPSDIFHFDADFAARERVTHVDPRLDRVAVGSAEVFETEVPLYDGKLAKVPQVYRAAELGYVDVSRLAITGQSFGGYGTGSIVSRTNLVRAAVPISGIYDWLGIYGHIDIQGENFWVA